MSDKQKCDGCRANEEAAIACLKLGGDELSSWQRTCWECAAAIRALRSGCDCLNREAVEKLTVGQVGDLRGRLHVGATGKHEHDAIDALCDLALSALNREYVSVPEGWKLVPLNPDAHMKTEGGRRLLQFQDGSTDASFTALQWAAVRNEAERVWRSMWLAAPARDEKGEV